jgi:hypothetical protein
MISARSWISTQTRTQLIVEVVSLEGHINNSPGQGLGGPLCVGPALLDQCTVGLVLVSSNSRLRWELPLVVEKYLLASGYILLC